MYLFLFQHILPLSGRGAGRNENTHTHSSNIICDFHIDSRVSALPKMLLYTPSECVRARKFKGGGRKEEDNEDVAHAAEGWGGTSCLLPLPSSPDWGADVFLLFRSSIKSVKPLRQLHEHAFLYSLKNRFFILLNIKKSFDQQIPKIIAGKKKISWISVD